MGDTFIFLCYTNPSFLVNKGTLMKRLIAFLIFMITHPGFATETRISLTSSDGTGLEFRQLEAKVVLDGFLAFTELQMVFYNPEERRREGQFQMILPDNAAISRFAMKINEQLQEGEVVEKQQARQAYEDFLHRRQDPALLEADSGNRFNARVFPIEPHAEKLLILSYSQHLDQDYTLPLKGLPVLKQLSIKVFYDSQNFGPAQHTQVGHLTGTRSKREILTVEKQNYQPIEDFSMTYQPKSPLSTTEVVKGMAMQSEQWVAARIIPFSDTATTLQHFDNLVILADVSASQAPFLSETIQQLSRLLPQLKAQSLLLYTFDQEIQEIGRAQTPEEQQNLLKKLSEVNALGASRVDKLFSTLQSLKLDKARILMISDAVVTAGEVSLEALKKIPWLERLDVVIPSYHSDKRLAHQFVQAGKSMGMVTVLSDQDLANKLTHTVYTEIPITVSGSTWYWPEKIETLHHDEPVFIFAELKEKQSFSISIGDKPIPITIQPANPLLLKRELARARIDKLLELESKTQDQDMSHAFRREILHLSVSERVLSPYTSLLVLETEDDYRRYHIDRRSLTDILTIGIEGITVVKRAGIESPISPPVVEVPIPMMGEKNAMKNHVEKSTLEEVTQKEDEETSKNQKQEIPSKTASPDSGMPSTKNGEIHQQEKGPSELVTPPTPPSVTPPKLEEDSLLKKKEESPSEKPKGLKQVEDKLSFSEPREEVTGKVTSSSHQKEVPSETPKPINHADGATPVDSKAAPFLPEEKSISLTEVIRSIGPSSTTESSVSEAHSPPQTHDTSLKEQADKAASKIAQQKELSSQLRASSRSELHIAEPFPPSEENSKTAVPSISPWTGKYAEFKTFMEKGDVKIVGAFVKQWRQEDLSDVMALIALGEWYEKTGDALQAARAYGSLIDYFPARADIRRWAGERLLKLDGELSVDTFKKAMEERHDHPSGHYLLAIAYWETGRYKEAVHTLKEALKMNSNEIRFDESVKRIFEETQEIMLTRLEQTYQLEELFPHETFERVTQRQLRFVLMWETDANDVDLHIYDAQQHHAYYSSLTLPTGGSLYNDVTTGYGPECFQIINPTAFPYKIQAHYYSRGPMGYGMGRVHVLEYIPNQMLKSEFRPFVVMQDGAFVDLGSITEPAKEPLKSKQ